MEFRELNTAAGALHGVRGIRDGIFVDLHKIPEKELKRIANTPSAALGSTRDKPDAAYTAKVLEGLKKVKADVFVNIGGNDTSGTQQILTDAAGGDMVFMHAPKTIDNDLMENDHTPGFPSAAPGRPRSPVAIRWAAPVRAPLPGPRRIHPAPPG